MSNVSFYVSKSVADSINKLSLSAKDKEIIQRCVGGYTKDSSDRMEKLRYRWQQYNASYPDWKESMRLLDTRKFDPIVRSQSSNISGEIVGTLAFAPWAAIGYLLEDSSKTKLEKLIKDNSTR